MPRLPKWLLLKEWLAYDDVMRVLDNSPTELENILSRDESEEFGYSYKFVCTFAPRDCQKAFKEYRFEQTARQSMRAHLKEHLKALRIDFSSDKEQEFLTRNQLFQQTKTNKQKLLGARNEVPAKKPRNSSKSNDVVTSVKEPAKEKSKPKRQRKNHQFTEIKQVSVDSENIQTLASCLIKTELTELNNPEIITSTPNVNNSDIPPVKEELTPHVQNELVDFGLEDQEQEAEIDDDDDFSDKISCETQTDHGKKEMETAQYRIATKLFAIDRTQWGNIGKALEELIILENASREITQDDKLRILEAMKQWMDSVRLYNRRATESLQDPLTSTEEGILESLTAEDWKRLDAADDPESKLRLTVYARMLLRDYVWYPRKLKPKVCRHCQRQYTASTSLYSHLVSLSGIRFWVCSKCKDANRDEATFTRKHSLQYHILKEVGIPRYRCSQPGCSKTHNHTHHQKSHARQHTGEQYYKCEISSCKVRFSNRNTYSRHLLQNHSTELTSANQLRAIDKTEAQMKVYAARLRARERSKCKRQQTHECSFKEKEFDKIAMQDRSLNQIEDNEAKCCDSEGVSSGLGKFMRPSASQLLYGIARDVRKTTSTIEGVGKPADNMLGGLNLLATVSKYMNAENCNDNQWKCESEKEKDKFSCVQNDEEPKVVDMLNDNKQGDSSQPSISTKGSLVSVLSSLPSMSSIPGLSQDVVSGDQREKTAACTSHTEVSTGEEKSKLTTSQVVITPYHKLPMTSGLDGSLSLPSSLYSTANESNSDATGTCALNVHLLGKKVILKPPIISTVMPSSQIHTSSLLSSQFPVKPNEKQDNNSCKGTLVMNVTQSQELKECAPGFSNVKAVGLPIGTTTMNSEKLAGPQNEITNPTSVIQESQNDSGNPHAKIAPPNAQLQLRSISSVSGKTYIILASSPKGNYTHNLQPYLKESDSKTGSKLVVGAAIPLS